MTVQEQKTRIIGFIASQQVFTLATCGSHEPWCAPCYYAFETDQMRLVFMSQSDTRHIREMLAHDTVAGSILPDRSTVGKIRGIQFTGKAVPCNRQTEGEMLRDLYFKRFPFARAMKGECYAVMLDTVKMTDNTLGFGSRLHWERTDLHHAQN